MGLYFRKVCSNTKAVNFYGNLRLWNGNMVLGRGEMVVGCVCSSNKYSIKIWHEAGHEAVRKLKGLTVNRDMS